jgi:hypothetical protein
MSKIRIPYAESDEAVMLQAISISAFKSNFDNYGHYPPGIESVEWHQDKIRRGIYHTIKYDDNSVGGICLSLHPDHEMKIEYFFISPEYQNKKIGELTGNNSALKRKARRLSKLIWLAAHLKWYE